MPNTLKKSRSLASLRMTKAVLAAALVLSVQACKKDDTASAAETSAAANDAMKMETSFDMGQHPSQILSG